MSRLESFFTIIVKTGAPALSQVRQGTPFLFLVGLFIPDLFKGKEPRLTKHIPKVPKMLVFTKNFETRKEYDYGKVHH